MEIISIFQKHFRREYIYPISRHVQQDRVQLTSKRPQQTNVPEHIIKITRIIQHLNITKQIHGLPHWLSGKESACNAGAPEDAGSLPGLGRSCGGGRCNPLQHSCLKNPWSEEPGGLPSTGLQSRTRLEPLSARREHQQTQSNFCRVTLSATHSAEAFEDSTDADSKERQPLGFSLLRNFLKLGLPASLLCARWAHLPFVRIPR